MKESNSTLTIPIENASVNNICGNAIGTGIALIMVMFFSGLGNGLIIGSSYLDPEIRHGGLLAMVSLAVTDLLFSNIFCIEALYKLICPTCPIEGIICQIISIIKLTLVIAVSYQHSFLAFTRYVAVYHPIKYRKLFATTRVSIMIASLFSLCILVTLLPSVLPKAKDPFLSHNYDNSLMVCIYKTSLETLIYTSLLFFCLPVSVGAYCYIACFLKLRHTSQSDSAAKKQKNMAFTMLIAYAMVLINSGPFPVMLLVYRDHDDCSLLKRYFSWLILANSCCNPVVYAWKSVKFRKMFARQLGINIDRISVAPISNMHTNG